MAEYIKVPAGVYDMVTRCMEQEFPDHVAIRYVAEDGKTVVEKKYREYAQDIRRMIKLAHAAGFAVMAHANGDRAVTAALQAGWTPSSTGPTSLRAYCSAWRSSARCGCRRSRPSGI